MTAPIADLIKAMDDHARHMQERGHRQIDAIAEAIDLAAGLRENRWSPQAAAMILRAASRRITPAGCYFLAAHMDLIADRLDPTAVPPQQATPAAAARQRPHIPRRPPAKEDRSVRKYWWNNDHT